MKKFGVTVLQVKLRGDNSLGNPPKFQKAYLVKRIGDVILKTITFFSSKTPKFNSKVSNFLVMM